MRSAAVHRALFALRHDEASHLESRDESLRCSPTTGWTLTRSSLGSTRARRCDRCAPSTSATPSRTASGAFPTFVAGDQAVFVRLMNRATVGADPAESIRTVERIVDLLAGWPDLNEFKHTSIPR